MLGVVISISRNNWVRVWMGLELNLLCFIPFLIQHQQIYREVRVIYFLTQACGSILLLISGVRIGRYEIGIKYFVIISLLLKVGAAPFHFWYVWVASGVKWSQFYILRTIQKLAPLVLLDLSRLRGKWIFYIRVILCGIVRIRGGIHTLSIRKLLVYSSIRHLGWIFIPLINRKIFWVYYFIVYCLILLIVIIVLAQYNIFHLGQLVACSLSKKGGATLLVVILSLGGLPPFLGFTLKWGVIIICRGGVDLICLIIIILSSVVRIYFYTRSRFNVGIINSVSKLFDLIREGKIISSFIVFLRLVMFWTTPLIIL